MIATVTLNPSLDEWIGLPSLTIGELNRSRSWARYPGGKGINVSRVIHELGGHTIAFGLAGGEDGMILRERINRLKLRHVFVDVPGSTRNNYKIQTDRPRALTEINSPGPWVSATALRALQHRLFSARHRVRALTLSGSLPPGAPADIYARWIRRFRLYAPVVLDASGEALRRGLRAKPWMIKPNRQETEELLTTKLSSLRRVMDAARHLASETTGAAIISLGKDGAVLASGRDVWAARPPKIPVESAVGAGDSLVGGFLWGWITTQSLPEAFRLGVACGTATAMTPGTELCHRRDIRRLLPRIRIHRLTKCFEFRVSSFEVGCWMA